MKKRLANESKKSIFTFNDFINFTDEIINTTNTYLDKQRSKFDLDTGIVERISPDTGMLIYIYYR